MYCARNGLVVNLSFIQRVSVLVGKFQNVQRSSKKMRREFIGLVVMVLAACSPAPAQVQRDRDLEAGRLEAAQLIRGRVSDWQRASPEGRAAYATASVAAMSPSAARDPANVRLFISCMDHLAESSRSYDPLADLSMNCAQAL
jgi:hypothetical protein